MKIAFGLIIVIILGTILGTLYLLWWQKLPPVSKPAQIKTPLVGAKLIEPVAEFRSRMTKKPFGIYITPQTSPVQPERFTGFHTGVDIEYGDIVGVTTYKIVWFKELKVYFPLPFPATYYWRRTQLVKKFFNKKVINIELQAEPWGPVLLHNLPIIEAKKTMNLEQFQKNIEFAKKTGLDTFYLWGAEWWYWLKTKQNEPCRKEMIMSP